MSTLPDSDLERLNAYIEGDLDPDEVSALEAELEQRPELQAELDALRETVHLFSSVPEPTPPSDFDRAVTRRIRRRSRGRYFASEARRERLAHVAIPLAALVVLALVAFLLDPGRLDLLLDDRPIPTEPADEDAVPDDAPEREDDPDEADGETGEAPRLPPTTSSETAIAAPTRLEYRYTLTATAPVDEVRSALRQRFGSRAIEEQPPGDDDPDGATIFVVGVDRAQLGPALQRMEDLGRIERARVRVDEASRQVPVRIVVAP